MQFARPPEGFRLVQRAAVDNALDELRSACPWLDQAYQDAVSRLRMSGHNEGRLSKTVPGLRSVVELDPATGRRRLGISYVVLGDQITIRAIRIVAIDSREAQS